MSKKSNLHWFVNGFLFIGVFFELAGLILGNKLLFVKMPEWYLYLISSLSLPWIVASCIFIMKYKEIPRYGLPSIKGTWAVVQGYIGLIFFSILELVVICLLLS